MNRRVLKGLGQTSSRPRDAEGRCNLEAGGIDLAPRVGHKALSWSACCASCLPTLQIQYLAPRTVARSHPGKGHISNQGIQKPSA